MAGELEESAGCQAHREPRRPVVPLKAVFLAFALDVASERAGVPVRLGLAQALLQAQLQVPVDEWVSRRERAAEQLALAAGVQPQGPVAPPKQEPTAQARPVRALARALVDARVAPRTAQDELLLGERAALASVLPS